MRPLQKLTFDAFRDMLATTFAAIADQRDPRRITWELPAVLMSAFALLFSQHPSLLEYQRRMQQRTGRSNLERVFAVEEIPSDTQMREILDGVPPEPLRRVLPQTFEQMRGVGWTARFVTEVGGEKYYPTVLEGSEYFHSTQIHCPSCLHQRQAHGETHYSHVVVAATVTRAGSHAILPLDAEEVHKTEGQQKQDCELTAAKGLVTRLRAEHRQLSLCIVGDDLYAHEPFIEELRARRLGFVRVAKPTSHRALFKQLEDREQRGECGGRGTWAEGAGRHRRSFEYRSAADVPLTQAGTVRVNFVEVWERRPDGTVGYHNSWVPDFVVTPETVASIVGIGRSRWKIENEQFNVHKNHGYEVAHNYGHGQQTLSLVFYLLNLLAFVAHKLLEFGDRLYQQCRAGESRRGLWTLFRSAFYLLEFDNWEALLHYHLRETATGP
ncbi:MAG: hypothetical protein HY268_22655 [Deltaproteobacteria bacterium]|nr:hypothetical protein [Deltaproteobacteria bacterium]